MSIKLYKSHLYGVGHLHIEEGAREKDSLGESFFNIMRKYD